jgi:hypothetical protein
MHTFVGSVTTELINDLFRWSSFKIFHLNKESKFEFSYDFEINTERKTEYNFDRKNYIKLYFTLKV